MWLPKAALTISSDSVYSPGNENLCPMWLRLVLFRIKTPSFLLYLFFFPSWILKLELIWSYVKFTLPSCSARQSFTLLMGLSRSTVGNWTWALCVTWVGAFIWNNGRLYLKCVWSSMWEVTILATWPVCRAECELAPFLLVLSPVLSVPTYLLGILCCWYVASIRLMPACKVKIKSLPCFVIFRSMQKCTGYRKAESLCTVNYQMSCFKTCWILTICREFTAWAILSHGTSCYHWTSFFKIYKLRRGSNNLYCNFWQSRTEGFSIKSDFLRRSSPLPICSSHRLVYISWKKQVY